MTASQGNNEVILAADWLANNWPLLAGSAVKITIVVVMAIIVRVVCHRAIDRLTSGETPSLLRPLKNRALQFPAPLRSERYQQRAKTIGSVLKSIVTFLAYGLAFLVVLDQLGVNLTMIVASVSVLGVALGLGAQSLVKDFLAGMFMLLEDQYGVGDVIDTGAASGTVEAVGLRVTKLRDGNGTVWYIRNGEVSRIGNSSQGFAIAVVDLPLTHVGSVDQALEVLAEVANEAAAEAPLVDDVLEAPQVLGVEKVTPEGITLRLTVKVRPGRQWATQRALRARIMAALHERGLEVAGPSTFSTDKQA